MSKEVREEAIEKIKAGVDELTAEERQAEVAEQIESRDYRELTKALGLYHQAYIIIHKRAARFNLEVMLEMLKSIIERILWILYKVQPAVLTLHRNILKTIDMTEEQLLAYWEEVGRA